MNTKNYGQDPENERKRIKELRSYNILDTKNEKDYDDLTALAAIICDTPIALISLVDEHRQWFKSAYGLGAEETHRQYSFCSHAILTPEEPLIIEDSREDDRFKNNPLVTGDPHVIFYAGIPLISENGHGLGSFCVIDSKPRMLSEKQLKGLKILAHQVMNLLEHRKATAELKLQKELLDIKSKNLDNIIAARLAEALRREGK